MIVRGDTKRIYHVSTNHIGTTDSDGNVRCALALDGQGASEVCSAISQNIIALCLVVRNCNGIGRRALNRRQVVDQYRIAWLNSRDVEVDVLLWWSKNHRDGFRRNAVFVFLRSDFHGESVFSDWQRSRVERVC